MAARQSILVRKKRQFFDFNWLPWQLSLRYRKNMAGLIICHSTSTKWCKDCENRSSGSWDTSAPSEQVRYETKLVAMAISLEILKKKFSDLSSTPKTLLYGIKTAKIARCLSFGYDTKLVAMATSLKKSKKRSGSRTFTQIPFIWWKDRENRSSRSWDIVCLKLKKEEINASKIQGAPIKNNPIAKMLYFSHGSTNLRQTFRLCMRIFTQHILQIWLK